MPPFLSNMFSDSDNAESNSSNVDVSAEVDVQLAVEMEYYREGENGEAEYHSSRQELGVDGEVSSSTVVENASESWSGGEGDYGPI